MHVLETKRNDIEYSMRMLDRKKASVVGSVLCKGWAGKFN